MKKLTALRLDALKVEGFHRDPECTGLYVQVSFKQRGDERSAKHGVSKSWVYRYVSPVTGKGRWMGLGPCDCVTIHEARDLARHARKLVTFKIDPIDERKAREEADRQAAIKEKASMMTFGACVDAYLAEKLPTFKNQKHSYQWKETLGRACKAFGDLNVAQVDKQTVIKFLTPIWRETPATADRLRGRLEKILDWATVHDFRQGENPCRWRGNLEHVFTQQGKNGHHEAMPFVELPAFMGRLRESDNIGARALEFIILTAARSGEACNARWSEVDLDKALWTIPAERMKAGREHIVPLSKQAVALLSGLPRINDYIFAGRFADKPISGDTLNYLFDKLDTNGYAIHGFRSTFRDWCGDATDFPREVAEAALAHQLSDKTEAAYRRGSALNKRRLLMEAWSQFCAGTAETSNVARLHG